MIETHFKESLGTLSQTLNELVKMGYTHDFNQKENSIIFLHSSTTLLPTEFKIDKVYRFEGDTDPQCQSILYAISSLKFNIKGTLVNGYGTSADDLATKLIEKLVIDNK